MNTTTIVSIDDCCKYYRIEHTFIDSLDERGLLHIIEHSEQRYLEQESLSLLERFLHLHYDLDINMEGLEAVSHLLEKMNKMRGEMQLLRNKLQRYE